MQPRERSGFELSPRDDDTLIEAWSSTVEGCFAEAVLGYVACFANVDAIETPQRMVHVTCEPAAEPEMLVEMLDAAIYLVDREGVVPVRVVATCTPEGGVAGQFGVVDSSTVDVFGPAPNAVRRPEARVEHEDGSWRCAVAVAEAGATRHRPE